VVAVVSVLLVGCGVRFRDPESGTEFFSAIEVSGVRQAQSPLTVLVSYEQFYPVDVDLACELRQGKSLVKELGRGTVPALADGSPEATPFVGSLAYDFTVDAPGSYKVECLTPKDEDNFISQDVTISPEG
jgi:hypothetical protein